MKIFTFLLHNYRWYITQPVFMKAYDEKQARKKLKKELSKRMSVPRQNSFIKAKNIKIRKVIVIHQDGDSVTYYK